MSRKTLPDSHATTPHLLVPDLPKHANTSAPQRHSQARP